LGYAYEKKGAFLDALETYNSVLYYDKENEVALSRLQVLQRRVK
jgi:hypothetical protein